MAHKACPLLGTYALLLHTAACVYWAVVMAEAPPSARAENEYFRYGRQTVALAGGSALALLRVRAHLLRRVHRRRAERGGEGRPARAPPSVTSAPPQRMAVLHSPRPDQPAHDSDVDELGIPEIALPPAPAPAGDLVSEL